MNPRCLCGRYSRRSWSHRRHILVACYFGVFEAKRTSRRFCYSRSLTTAGELPAHLGWCRWVFLFLVFVFLLSCLPFCLSALLALFACLLSPRSALLASFSFFSFLSVFPPCFFLFVLSVSFFLPSLSFCFSLLSLFSSLLFSSNRLCCHNNKGKSTRTEKQTEKIIDNSGSVWLTGVNRASLKMGLNLAFLFTGPFQGVVNVPAGRSVGLRVYGRTPAGILELQSRYSPP